MLFYKTYTKALVSRVHGTFGRLETVTLFAMMPTDPRKAIQEELHNALADCYYQAKCVQSTYKHFGVKSRWGYY